MLKIGSLVDGKYRILNQCGHGGMSVVYMAINERANKTWAIKEVRKDGSHNFEVVKQGLLVEINMLKKLKHPHLPGIVDVIDGKDSLLIVMDFIEGRTLQDILKEYGPQRQEDVIAWAIQLCDVLGYLHSRTPAIVYRDMKPSNIMRKPDGNVMLFDFGTAREYKIVETEDTVCLGTKGYAAPEQYGGQGQTDARTDIYCLGATMYHLLTGHNPGEPPYRMYPIRQWNPRLSAGLEAVIEKCIQDNPGERYQSCTELRYALEHYWETDTRYRRQQAAKLRRFLLPAALTLFLGAAAAVFHGMEKHITASNYDAYLAAARNSVAKEEEIANYEKAIRLNPSREEGYLELLQNAFLDDNLLTVQESERLRGILIEYGDKEETHETAFRKNRSGYEQFAYEAGIAYYYKFEEKANKKNARAYFETAVLSEALEERQVERARRLYKISDYYSKIGVLDETGDAMISYRDYWDDLVELSKGNLVEADNERTALILYEEMAGQIASRTLDFKYDGVTREEMEAQLTKIREHLQTDFRELSERRRGAIEEELGELGKALQQAERMIQSAFRTEKWEEEL